MAIIIPAKRKFAAPPLVRTGDDRRDPLNLGLVGHWSMDAETINGTQMLDLSGRDNHGTLASGPTLVPGPVGQALSFNGSTQQIVVASVPNIDFTTTTPFSHSLWVYPASNANMNLIAKLGSVTNGWATQLNYNDSKIGALVFRTAFCGSSFPSDSSIVFDNTNNLTTGRWYHLVVTYDGSGTYTGIKLYVNGVAVTTGTTITGNFANGGISSAQPLRIGTLGDGSGFFNGYIDDVRIQNRALTPAEAYQLYADPARERVPYQTRGRVRGPTGAVSITGTLAVTEANDTIAAVGRVAVSGTLAVTEQADTIAAAGAVRVAGTLSRTEANDTLTATGTVAALGAITGNLSALQAVQTLIATGQIRVNGGLNVSQAAQTLAATGIVGSVVPPPSGQGVQVIIMS